MTPLEEERDFFRQSGIRQGAAVHEETAGRLPVFHLPEMDMTLACGGLGKAQFAVQTQHLLDADAAWDMVVCAGAAGGLHDDLSVGDVVVATQTVEHDIHNHFGPPIVPKFEGAAHGLAELRRIAPLQEGITTHFDVIASGDEDVVAPDRRAFLQETFGAVAVAWEGAGGARACAFSSVPFLEIRGITDAANDQAPSEFKSNLHFAMDNVARLIMQWVQKRRAP